LFVNHPEHAYNSRDLQEYLKSEGFDIEEHELIGILVDMIDMKIIEDIDYYKLNTENPAVKYLFNLGNEIACLEHEIEFLKKRIKKLEKKELIREE